MSYTSLIKTLPETLSSSTGKACLTSLGIHGLVFAVLPLLPLNSESRETQSRRTVELVELTPAEQSRLPQFSTSQNTLPPSAEQLSGLPPLPPAPDFRSVFPPLPSVPNINQSGLPPLPPIPNINQSVLPPLPPPPALQLPPPVETPVYKYPLASSLPQTPSFLVPRLSAPLPNNEPFTSRFNVGKLPQPVPSQTQSPPQLSPPYKQPASLSLPDLGLKPAERFSLPVTPPSPTALENTNPQNQEFTIANQSKNPPATFPLAEKLPERGKQELLALREKLRQSRNSSGTNTAVTAPQNSQQQVARSLQTPPQATSPLPEKLPGRGKQELLALQEKLRQSRNSSGTDRAVTAPQNSQQQVVRSLQTPPQATSPLPEKLPERSEQELLALREKLRESRNSSLPEKLPERGREQLLARQQELREQSVPKPVISSTSAETTEKIAQLRTWSERQNTVQENHPKVVTPAPIYKTLNRCQKELDGGIAVLGVVINPEGKIVSGPDLLSKKGAAGVAVAAKNYVKGYPFPKTDNSTNQQFHLQFKCSEPSPQPSGDNTDEKQPQS